MYYLTQHRLPRQPIVGSEEPIPLSRTDRIVAAMRRGMRAISGVFSESSHGETEYEAVNDEDVHEHVASRS